MNFVVLIVMCTIAAVFNGIQDARGQTSASFFEIDVLATDIAAVNAIITFVSVLLYLHSMHE